MFFDTDTQIFNITFDLGPHQEALQETLLFIQEAFTVEPAILELSKELLGQNVLVKFVEPQNPMAFEFGAATHYGNRPKTPDIIYIAYKENNDDAILQKIDYLSKILFELCNVQNQKLYNFINTDKTDTILDKLSKGHSADQIATLYATKVEELECLSTNKFIELANAIFNNQESYVLLELNTAQRDKLLNKISNLSKNNTVHAQKYNISKSVSISHFNSYYQEAMKLVEHILERNSNFSFK